ncbi:MAG: chitobiase/beta-hexosaminidase C-terminal domain-containing protein [Candidatus Nealsonbacteria bacterium]
MKNLKRKLKKAFYKHRQCWKIVQTLMVFLTSVLIGSVIVEAALNTDYTEVTVYFIDDDFPSIDAFDVSPTLLNIAGPDETTISWTVSDTGGSHLWKVEVWRAPDDGGAPGTWSLVSTHPAPEDSDSWSSSATDSPSDGIWWYGLHVLDKAENEVTETESGFTPIQVIKDKVRPPKPTCEPGTGTYINSVDVSCSSGEEGVTLRYTTDGSSPIPSSPQYTSPFNFTVTTVLTVANWDSADNRSESPDNSYTYTIEINNPPTAGISCNPTGCGLPLGQCTGYTGCPFKFVNESTDPEGDGDIIKTEWDIYLWGSDPDDSCNYKCDFTPSGLSTTTSSTVEVYVRDSVGGWDSTTKNFTILQEAIADFECSLKDVGPWIPCEGFGVSEGEMVYFKDGSSSSDGGSPIVSWSWTFEDGEPPTSSSQNASSTFTKVDGNSGTVALQIQDYADRTNTASYQLGIAVSLPEWKEVSP